MGNLVPANIAGMSKKARNQKRMKQHTEYRIQEEMAIRLHSSMSEKEN
ncbi:hypothetical protein [Pollutibacter soli]